MKAPINKIIPFSTVDGPGNRTAIFFQGCNLDCTYCHNPETRKLCIHCGDCVAVCPAGAIRMQENRVVYDIKKCQQCDSCIRICSHDSSPKIQELTPQEVFEKVQKQQPFIRGITVSGGECSLYPDFLKELFILCQKAGLTTFMDTNGMLDLSNYPELLEVTDKVMLDVKAFDSHEHQIVTGDTNENVLKNAILLARMGKLYEIRTVVVPGLFNMEGTIKEVANLLKPYQSVEAIRYKLIAYREVGVRAEYAKYKQPGQSYMESLADILRHEDFLNIIII